MLSPRANLVLFLNIIPRWCDISDLVLFCHVLGFPKQCPAMCPCKTYDCRGGFQETCGFSEGFCQMVLNAPVEYKINWVRVYQDTKDPNQKVGCSTPERPTRTFIKGHEKRYKLETDVS